MALASGSRHARLKFTIHRTCGGKRGNALHVPLSSRNKLPFMVLSPRSKLQKNRFSGRNMHFPTEKCNFLPKNALSYRKNALSCRKMHFPAEKCGLRGAHGRKLQETAGGLQGSRITHASQLSQDIDTEIKAKPNNMISELITFRITEAKTKVKFGVKCLCEHECKRSSVPISINANGKRQDIWEDLISLQFLLQRYASTPVSFVHQALSFF